MAVKLENVKLVAAAVNEVALLLTPKLPPALPAVTVTTPPALVTVEKLEKANVVAAALHCVALLLTIIPEIPAAGAVTVTAFPTFVAVKLENVKVVAAAVNEVALLFTARFGAVTVTIPDAFVTLGKFERTSVFAEFVTTTALL